MTLSFRELHERSLRSNDYWAFGISISFIVSCEDAMKALGITKTELARRMGTSPAYVTKILRGDVNFTLETLIRITRALGQPIGDDDRQRQALQRFTRAAGKAFAEGIRAVQEYELKAQDQSALESRATQPEALPPAAPKRGVRPPSARKDPVGRVPVPPEHPAPRNGHRTPRPALTARKSAKR